MSRDLHRFHRIHRRDSPGIYDHFIPIIGGLVTSNMNDDWRPDEARPLFSPG